MNKGEKHPLPSFILCRQTDRLPFSSCNSSVRQWRWYTGFEVVIFVHLFSTLPLSWCPNSVRFLYKTKRTTLSILSMCPSLKLVRRTADRFKNALVNTFFWSSMVFQDVEKFKFWTLWTVKYAVFESHLTVTPAFVFSGYCSPFLNQSR